VVLLFTAVSTARGQEPVLTVQQTGTSALLQAVSVSARDPRTVWISGHRGTYVTTTDAGTTWRAAVVPGRDSMQYRDVHAIDAQRAWLMSAGNGPLSTILQTTDGGATWEQVFLNSDSASFYDCMAFWDEGHGFAISDASKGRMPILSTSDGRVWSLSSIPAQEGEGAFAASGTCAVAQASGDAWIGTGVAAFPRVLHSADRGRTWTEARVPLAHGSDAGVAGLAFRDRKHGVAVGGSLGGSAQGPRVAQTKDGGRTWSVMADPPITGALYGAAYARVAGRDVVVAVGPGGAVFSRDDGASWMLLDPAPYWSVGFGQGGVGWLAGPRGRVVRVEWR
jgi:photosystem II stability/assembly factor-like uncharacterized protein